MTNTPSDPMESAHVHLPLKGTTVVVTRAAFQSVQFTALLESVGATVIEMPALAICPPSSWSQLDRAILNLEEFDWLILTSTNGVDYFFSRFKARGQDAQALAGVKIAVVGQKTAQALQKRGFNPDFTPPDFVSDSLVEYFPDRERLEGKTILYPTLEEGGRDFLVEELTLIGAKVLVVPAYHSCCTLTMQPEVITAFEQALVDVVTFASPKTVKCFRELLLRLANGNVRQLDSLLQTVCIASIGPTTSVACQQVLGRVDVEAIEYTLDGLTEVLVQWKMSKTN